MDGDAGMVEQRYHLHGEIYIAWRVMHVGPSILARA
jgi:hypothetical protein